MTLTITINGETVQTVGNVPFQSGQNVQQALEAAYTANPNLAAILSFSAQYYGQLGYELSTLDSISNQKSADGSSSLFWELLVNGAVTQTGMDTTFPSDGDTVEWNYTAYSPERHQGSNYESIHAPAVN